MTRDEWIEVGYSVEGTTDIQLIIGQILSS
jgi:hypothetical protein